MKIPSNIQNQENEFHIKRIHVIILIAILLCGVLMYKINHPPKTYTAVPDLLSIPAPQQSSNTGRLSRKAGSTDVDITIVANYTIYGRVVDRHRYFGGSVINNLSKIDLGIAWGFMATDEAQKHFKWSSYGTRFLRWKSQDLSWVDAHGGTTNIGKFYSNNHLIPDNSNIDKLLKMVKVNDYIKIDGYLVNADYTQGKYTGYWHSSTSRDDQGDGACEIIYVKDISWLKAENN